ncbi:MAG: radical SAM protein [Anaerolineae bacterium]|nr:radical SAM protein [Anaerolineae bacterium]MDW8072205.1 radical SAM protein [Anaerolineae bacterium]
MQIIRALDSREKIELLSRLAALECDGDPCARPARRAKADFLSTCVVQVRRPEGPIPVLRTMQSSVCERNCHYCAFRAGHDGVPRLKLTPDELACAFDAMQRAGIVRGLFLSSGLVGGGARTMDPMLTTVELLRHKYLYRGYIHLKIMPGAEEAQIEQALRLADRVSVNLEGPDPAHLAIIAPQKDFELELLAALQWVHRLVQSTPPGRRRPSWVTQFVVGPAGESDRDLLRTASRLYREVGLARAYYSAFNPVPGTPLDHLPPTPVRREQRLYQADWLLRLYGFSVEELPFDRDGALPIEVDPKLAWAHAHLAHHPVELNRCSRQQLLRVPGIGPRTADTILEARRHGRLRDLSDLRALGVSINRAAPFILLDGRRPPYQLKLWNAGECP